MGTEEREREGCQVSSDGDRREREGCQVRVEQRQIENKKHKTGLLAGSQILFNPYNQKESLQPFIFAEQKHANQGTNQELSYTRRLAIRHSKVCK